MFEDDLGEVPAERGDRRLGREVMGVESSETDALDVVDCLRVVFGIAGSCAATM